MSRITVLLKQKYLLIVGIFLVLAITFIVINDVEGIYIFKSRDGNGYEIATDFFLGEEGRLVWRVEFEPLHELLSMDSHLRETQDIRYEWDERSGRGFFLYHLPQGQKFLMCFSRFRDSDGMVPRGLFVGGGLPVARHEDTEVTLNETGVAFYTGSEWHHIWCSVNEAVASSSSPEKQIPPSQWEYRGSKVIRKRNDSVAVRSSHRVFLDGQPVRIDRYAFFHAGTTFFTLISKFTNDGTGPAGLYYVYGDEPWVGEFGTSRGNVGWSRDRLHFFETEVDLTKTTYAGFADYGNPYVPGDTGKTRLANFIEWWPVNAPDLVYFSNTIGKFAQEKEKVPLSSSDNRVFFLQWGPRVLPPGRSLFFPLNVGMAVTVPGAATPVKPPTGLLPEDYALMEQDQASLK